MTKVYEYDNKVYVEHENTVLQVLESKEYVETNIELYIDNINKIKGEIK